MKKLLVLLALFASPAFAQETDSPEVVADQTVIAIELRFCPNDPQNRVLIFLFNDQGQRIELDSNTIKVSPLNSQLVKLVFSSPHIQHFVHYVNKACGEFKT